MENIRLEQVRPSEKSTKPEIIALFKVYCIDQFGSDEWNRFMENDHFFKMIELKPLLGISIFKELADTVSEIKNIQLKDLLHDFAEFIRKYY